MNLFKGFQAFTVSETQKNELSFDGDLKMKHQTSQLSEVKDHFFEMISRENDVVLSDHNIDPLWDLKQKFVKDSHNELLKIIHKGHYNMQGKDLVYIYIMEFGGTRQTGIIVDLDHQCYENEVIHPHEETLANKIEIIARMTKESGVFNGFPIIFSSFEIALTRLLDDFIKLSQPFLSVKKDSISHIVFKLDLAQSAQVLELTRNIKQAFIADGHHRFKGFAKFVKDTTPEEQSHLVPGFNRFPVYLVADNHLQIKKFHRVVLGLDDFNVKSILTKLKKRFFVKRLAVDHLDPSNPEQLPQLDETVTPRQEGEFTFFFHPIQKWYTVLQKNKVQGNAAESLDIKYLSDHFFGECLGITDISKTDNIRYYPSIMGNSSFIGQVPDAQITIFCKELSIDQVKQVALEGLKMPPKATLFYPKPLLGFLFKSNLKFDEES